MSRPGHPTPARRCQIARHTRLSISTPARPARFRLAVSRERAPDSSRLAARAEPPSVAVVGGGAAGLTAAYFAARGGAQVTILERNAEAGKKILISGGTRCNVLPADVDLERDFFSESPPSALRAVFSSWSLPECKRWLEEEICLSLAYEAATRKFFPASNSARDVRDRLLAACVRAGAHIRTGASLEGLQPTPRGWRCSLAAGAPVEAERVVLATGGLSFPKLGTDGTGLRLLQALGHALHPPYPALTPLKGRHVNAAQLAGLSLHQAQLRSEAPASSGGKGRGPKRRRQAAVAERSDLLFTHRGFSGPAVLDISHRLVQPLERGEPPPALLVDWTGEGPTAWQARLAANGAARLPAALRSAGIPARLADALTDELGLRGQQAAQLRKADREALLRALTAYPLDCSGHEGYPKAEVTGGGVRLSDVDCATLQSRVCPPGLFVAGELLDVFGRIGGFNFYWAWVSGRLAGIGAAQRP